jgi:hypothetical protein
VSGASSLASALPGDLVALTWSEPPTALTLDGQVWTRWAITLTLHTGPVALHFDLLITDGTDRWRQGWYRCRGCLRTLDSEIARFETSGDAYGVIGASFDGETPPPALAYVLTALLARPHPDVTAVWDGLENKHGFDWMNPILEAEVLRVDGTPLDPCLEL